MSFIKGNAKVERITLLKHLLISSHGLYLMSHDKQKSVRICWYAVKIITSLIYLLDELNMLNSRLETPPLLLIHQHQEREDIATKLSPNSISTQKGHKWAWQNETKKEPWLAAHVCVFSVVLCVCMWACVWGRERERVWIWGKGTKFSH